MVTTMNKIIVLTVILMAAPIVSGTLKAEDFKCAPTPEDSLGPFYKPNAPIRSAVGEGYVLSGTVKSARDCSKVPGAKIEFWLAGTDGSYDDDHRATVLADDSSAYRFESNLPPKYNFRPPHIHIRVTAEGFRTLVTQHYPKAGTSKGDFPLVLVPR
jgi:protocatechuate 3,4-dioxygenase beta subunit